MASFFKITAGAAIVATALYAVAGFVGVPSLVKQTLSDKLGKELNRNVSVGEVTFNPLTWEFELHDLVVAGKHNQPPLASLKRLRIDASAQTLTAFAPVLDEVTIDGLHACLTLDDEDIRRYLAGDTTTADRSSDGSTADNKGGALPQFALYNISVRNSSLQVIDRARAIDQSITDFDLQLPFVSTLPNAKESLVTPSLSMKLNGTPIIATGTTKPFGSTLEARLNARISNLDLLPVFKLVPSLNTPALTLDGGKLSSDLNFIFRNPTGGNPGKMLLSGTATLSNVAASQTISNRHQSLGSIGKVTVQLTELDLIERQAKIGNILIQDPKVMLVNSTSGLNAAKTADAFASGDASGTPASGSTQDGWHWSVDNVQVRNGTTHWTDTTVKPQVKLTASALNATLTGLSSDPSGKPATAQASVKVLGGTLDLNADVVAKPLTVNAALKAGQLHVGQLNGYIRQALGFDAAGTIGLNLKTSLKNGALTGNGTGLLTGFQLREGKSTLVSAKKAALTIGSLDLKQRNIRIKNAELDGALVNAVMTKNGLNLMPADASTATDAPTKEAARPNAKGETWQWAVETAKLRDARLNFKDTRPRPNAVLNVSDIDATVQHLSSAPGSKATVAFSAKTAGGSAALNGSLGLSPFTTDLKTSIKQIGLKDLHSVMTAYTGIGARSGTLNSEGRFTVTQEKQPIFAWSGDIGLADFNMTNARNRSLMMWKDATLAGVDVKTTDPIHLRVAQAVIDQPGTKETQHVREAASIVGALAALAGKDKLTSRIDKVEKYMDGKIVLNDILYENGRFSANGVSANSVAGAILNKLSKEMSAKLGRGTPTTATQPAATPTK